MLTSMIFANQMHDICEAMGIEWSVIRDIITAPQDQMIGDSHLEPIMGADAMFEREQVLAKRYLGLAI